MYAQIVDQKKLNSKNVRKNRAKKCQVLEIVSNLSCLIDLKTSQLRWKFTGSISEFFISWTTARSFLLPHKVLSNKWKVNFHYERSPNFAFYKAKKFLEKLDLNFDEVSNKYRISSKDICFKKENNLSRTHSPGVKNSQYRLFKRIRWIRVKLLSVSLACHELRPCFKGVKSHKLTEDHSDYFNFLGEIPLISNCVQLISNFAINLTAVLL